MTTVYLGLGSNIQRELSIAAGLDALALLLGELSLSAVYDSPAIGFDGESFLNMVVGVETLLPLAELAPQLRQIETAHGRPVNATRFSARQLDIDILTYGSAVGVFAGVVLPRGEILENAFVLRPLAELAPAAIHPSAGISYASLWRAFDQASQPLRRVDFNWRGRCISQR
ncbi:MAG TPA: 2-amino-4-hydroxy-6-hydroxymethyldihydropteridine diphosphokinase [Kineobactrum sp.]